MIVIFAVRTVSAGGGLFFAAAYFPLHLGQMFDII